MRDDIKDTLDSARALIRARRVNDAERVLSPLLKQSPKNSGVLGLMAEINYIRGDKRLAKTLWKKSLNDRSQPWVHLSNLHSFLHALLIDKERNSALKHASRKLPNWPTDQAPGEVEKAVLIDLADILTALDQSNSARRLLEEVSVALPEDNKLKASLGLMQMLQGDYAAALKTLGSVDRAIQPRTDLSLLVRIYQCADKLGDEALKDALLDRAVGAHPVYIAPRSPGQKKSILVINIRPKLTKTIRSARDMFFEGNFPTQLASKLADEFHFSSLFGGIEKSRESASTVPTPDLIINNAKTGEFVREAGLLSTLVGLIDEFGVPVINHPDRVASTTREETARLVADISGVVAPGTVRFSKTGISDIEMTIRIEEHFHFPLIMRSLAMQEGKGMRKINDRQSLMRALAETPSDFYVTQFVDNRDESGFYRKIRAAVVGDEMILVRVDYDTQWNIHGRKSQQRVKFYQDHPHLLEQENRICSDPDGELGPAVTDMLREIRKKIPLEIFGIDFDVTGDGKLLFFEANASMNLLSTAPPAVNHPTHAEQRLLTAFRRYLDDFGNNRA